MQKENHQIQVINARTHNLKNVSLSFERDQLVVITGLSGSGKSSLAFDTIYAEGQRRYMETFNAYARQFLGNLERPDVDKIEGLSPVIAIEQKTTNKSPRSTVGTITEIYDFIRLLYARIADAYSITTNKLMVSYTDQQIVSLILNEYKNRKIGILAPIIKSRKGHYRELFESIRKKGYLKVRVDGTIQELTAGMKVDRYKIHDIEVIIDRLVPDESSEKRLLNSVQSAMSEGDNALLVYDEEDNSIRFFSRNLMCPDTGISYELPEPNSFSFNSPKGMCPKCKGLSFIHTINREKVIPNNKVSIENGGIEPLGEKKNNWTFKQLEQIAMRYKFSLSQPIHKVPEEALSFILNGGHEKFEIPSTSLGVTRNYEIDFEGVYSFILNQYNNSDSSSIKRWAKEYLKEEQCIDCQGSRLKKEALHFKIENKSIAELVQLDLEELKHFFVNLHDKLNEEKKQIAGEILKEINARIQFLLDVGLHYLTLNRSSKSLSGGEAQRIRLATQIGAQLVGVLYILDEPSIGLHQRDNNKLISSLLQLRDLGNTVLVVEHDEDMILKADHVIDIGPGAGRHGGEIVSQSSPKELKKSKTLTAQYISGAKKIEIPKKRRKGNGNFIQLNGCTGHNLKNVDLKIPLGTLTVISGVSGSGKSTLINGTLYPILNNHYFNGVMEALPFKNIKGLEHCDKVIDVNQSPIGRTPRSNPATYTGVFSEIRSLFSKTTEAVIRGYKPGRFSFNVKGGRCETCMGGGLRVIEMNFLPDVYVNCEQCNGKRFNRETLEIRYKGKTISDVLEMTINEAVSFFEAIPKIYRKLKTIQDVGLGYITLGQQSTTLSGGEAQRVKLATELSKRDTGNTFYILDEPTTGLHFEDIRILMEVIHKLVERGNTVLIIEHNLDIIKLADYIIDIGPEGGKKGGTIVAQGTPEKIIKTKASYTGIYLKEVL